MTPRVAMTIAGSDSCGGAGIQADLKAFAANGVFGTSAITALTAQNTTTVSGIHVTPPEFVVAQIESVLDDFEVRAVKTGMLATVEIMRAVAEMAAASRLPHLVVDPVMLSTAGDRLLDEDGERTYLDLLFPHAVIVTPNLSEAGHLVGEKVETVDEMVDAARLLLERGPGTVVVKGGHLHGDAVDVVVDHADVRFLRAPRVDTANNHGTGCSFAASTAAFLALGDDPWTALGRAKSYVHRALIGGSEWRVGHGPGPVDHFGWETS